MKKIYVMAAFLGASLFTFSQKEERQLKTLATESSKSTETNTYQKALGEVIWHENFDSIIEVNTTNTPYDTTIITSSGFWTIDNDGETADEFGWTIGEDNNGWTAMANDYTSTSGNSFAQLQNGKNPEYDPNTGLGGDQKLDKVYTMTSDIIDISTITSSTDLMLTFEQYGALFNDKQYIEISTDGSNWTEVYNNNHKEALTGSGGSEYPNPEVIEVDLSSELTGATDLQIRFGWTSQFPTENNPVPGQSGLHPNVWITYGWLIDDIKLTEKSDFDLVFESVDYEFEAYQYSQVPADQVSEMMVYAFVKNQGSQDLTDVVLNVMEGGTTVASSSPVDLAAGTSDSLGLTFMPDNSIGIKSYTFDLEMNETDDNPANNQIAKEVKLDVNENIYAADKLDFGAQANEYSLQVPLQGGNTAEYMTAGVHYDMFADKELTALDIRIETGDNQEISVGIEELGQSGWNFVAESDVQVISNTDLGVVQTVPFNSAITLTAGTTYRVYVNTFGNELVKLASAGKTSFPAQSTFYDGTDHINITNMYDIPVIRMNFDQTLSTTTNEVANLNVSQNYPNPFANETTVKFNLKDATDVSYSVVDLTGKVVTNVDEGKTMAGDHKITIDGSSFANGVYYLNINAGETTVTRKIIVNK